MVDAVFINMRSAERSEHRHMNQKFSRHQFIFILSSLRPTSSQAFLAIVSSLSFFEDSIDAFHEDVPCSRGCIGFDSMYVAFVVGDMDCIAGQIECVIEIRSRCVSNMFVLLH